MMLTSNEINEDLIRQSEIFHFGSLSMTSQPCRDATKYAVELAKKENLLITYDPNLRESLWDNLDEAKEMIKYGMSMCDVMKISDNEVLWFTGKDNYDDAITAIKNNFKNIKLILLSLGKEGSRAYLGDTSVTVPGFIQKYTIETTGAGDTFFAAVIDYIIEYGLNLNENQLREMLRRANAAASIITTRKGAIRVMPTKQELQMLLN